MEKSTLYTIERNNVEFTLHVREYQKPVIGPLGTVTGMQRKRSFGYSSNIKGEFELLVNLTFSEDFQISSQLRKWRRMGLPIVRFTIPSEREKSTERLLLNVPSVVN